MTHSERGIKDPQRVLRQITSWLLIVASSPNPGAAAATVVAGL
jgi:hypothetical protein